MVLKKEAPSLPAPPPPPMQRVDVRYFHEDESQESDRLLAWLFAWVQVLHISSLGIGILCPT